jgi:hypothetical protein
MEKLTRQRAMGLLLVLSTHTDTLVDAPIHAPAEGSYEHTASQSLEDDRYDFH